MLYSADPVHQSILTVKELSHKTADNRLLLDKLSLTVQRGQFIVITGPSGGGKSTLMRLLVRLEDIQSGTIMFNGEDLNMLSPPVLRTKMVMLQQTPTLSHGTVRENLLLPYSFLANQSLVPPSSDQLREHLDQVLLHDVDLEASAVALSVGQRQRLCLLRSVFMQPEVLLLDEPVSALDPVSKKVVEKMTEELNKEGLTIIMISHAPFVSQQVVVRRLALDYGRLQQEDCHLEEGLQ